MCLCRDAVLSDPKIRLLSWESGEGFGRGNVGFRPAVLNFSSLFPSQDKVLPSLASTLDLLLADGTWLLEQHALEAFTKFAEVTLNPSCTSLVCLVQQQSTK